MREPLLTDEEIGAWTSEHDIMLGPDGIDSRRMYPESVIPTAEVTAKLREMRDAHADLLAATKAFVEAWEKSHQLEKTDVALRMAKAAIKRAEAQGGSDG